MENPSDLWDDEYKKNRAIPSSTRLDVSRSLSMMNRQLPDDVDRVVELGCGNGRNLLWLSNKYPDSEIIGVDFSEEAVSNATELVSSESNIRVVQADVLEWLDDQPSNSIDVAVDSYFSQHLIDRETFRRYNQLLQVAVEDMVYWSAVGIKDEYYSSIAKQIDEQVFEDPANNVQKFLYRKQDVENVFDEGFHPEIQMEVRFKDTVNGEVYERVIHSACFVPSK